MRLMTGRHCILSAENFSRRFRRDPGQEHSKFSVKGNVRLSDKLRFNTRINLKLSPVCQNGMAWKKC